MHNTSAITQNEAVVCVPPPPSFTRGIWFNENPFLQPRLIFLYQLILMIWLSQLLHFVLKRLNQPKFVCFVLAGIILGPPLTGHIDGVFFKKATFPRHETLLVAVWAYIGMLTLIFLVAVKMDLSIIRKNVKNASIIGLTSVFCSHLVISMLTNVTHPNPSDDTARSHFPMIEQFSFSISSTRLSNMMYTFHELNIVASEIGQLVTSVAVCTEVLSWMWVVISIAASMDNVSPWTIIGCSVLLVAVTICTVRPFMMWICRKTPEGQPVREIYMVVCILLVLCWGVIADFVGSFYIGILAIGLVVPSGPPLGFTLYNKIEPFVMEIIMPMFYLLVGSRVNIQCISRHVFIEITFLVIMGVTSKFFGAFATGLACKVKLKHAVLLGLMLNIRGPIDLFVLLRWNMENQFKHRNGRRLNTEYYSVLVITELIVTVILSPMIVPLYRSCFRIRPTTSKRRHMRTLQITPDNTELRVLCSVFNQGSVPCIASLIEALKPTVFSPLSVHIVHITELMGRAAPHMDSYDQLEKVKSKRLYQIIVAFGNNLKAYSKIEVLKVRAHNVVAPYNSMHEYICRLALEEELCLILVPFHKSTNTFHEFDRDAASGLRTFNINMRIHAPCSVGIIVDRSICHNIASLSPSGYAVAVVFIGGPDDREALSLGIRLSWSPMARVTLLRIEFNGLYRDNLDKTESKLDFRLVDEFKLRNRNNNHAEYFEMEAKDADDVLSGIRMFIGDKHDLIIVGQAHKNITKAVPDDVILDLSENPELGMIGDFIASSDFFNSTSILVMHHYGGSNIY